MSGPDRFTLVGIERFTPGGFSLRVPFYDGTIRRTYDQSYQQEGRILVEVTQAKLGRAVLIKLDGEGQLQISEGLVTALIEPVDELELQRGNENAWSVVGSAEVDDFGLFMSFLGDVGKYGWEKQEKLAKQQPKLSFFERIKRRKTKDLIL